MKEGQMPKSHNFFQNHDVINRSDNFCYFVYADFYILTFVFSVVVIMGTTEAAAAAASTNGDFGSTHVMQQQWSREWVRRASTPVTHTVVPSLHLPHTPRENPQPGCS